MEPIVPETHRARALVWGALAAAALAFAVAPSAPGRLALVADTAGCRLDVASSGLERCACERTPLAVREALALPAALNARAAGPSRPWTRCRRACPESAPKRSTGSGRACLSRGRIRPVEGVESKE